MSIAIRFALPALAILCPTVAAQDKKPTEPSNPGAAHGKGVVEVHLSAEHIPAGLKSGDKVVVMRVNGKSVTRQGKVA